MPDTALPDTVAGGPGADQRAFSVSDSAARRIALLIEREGKPELMLRLTVSGGGCSGFQYGFGFDSAVNDDDHIFSNGDVRVVTDDTSLDLLDGSTLDYVEDLMAAAFEIKNPNASSSCGCGNSFSV